VQALRLRTVLPANWAAGLAEAAEAGVFVTPPVAGWVLVAGADVARRTDPEQDVLPLLQALSQGGGQAAWFCSDDEADTFGWALARDGEVVRAYAYGGERGHTLWLGDVTDAERDLACFVDDPRDGSDDEVKWWPDRRLVHALARAWSIDPDSLPARGLPPATGAIGRL
jgi:hypothetical protein